MSLEVEVDGELVHLSGDLDAQTAPLLDEAVDRAAEDGSGRVVLDLSRVEFVDSSGLRSMVRAAGPGGEREVVLRSPGRATRRILDITGLSDRFRIEP
jgi:anti-sigma B factor antagonist